jgi:hypothetical protein
LASLRSVLDPHLLPEEQEMMPVVSKTQTHAQCEGFKPGAQHQAQVQERARRQGHWLIDSIDSAGYKVVVGSVPPIPRFILLHAFAGRYARDCAARWGSAVSIKPLPA